MQHLIKLFISEIRVYKKENGMKKYIFFDELSCDFKNRGVFLFYLPFVPMAGDEIPLSEVDLLNDDLTLMKRNNDDYQLRHINVFVANRTYFDCLNNQNPICVNAYLDIPEKGNWVIDEVLTEDDFYEDSISEKFFKNIKEKSV